MKPLQALIECKKKSAASSNRITPAIPECLARLRVAKTPKSGLDLLIDPTDKTTLFDLAGIKIDLEKVLGFSVYIVIATWAIGTNVCQGTRGSETDMIFISHDSHAPSIHGAR